MSRSIDYFSAASRFRCGTPAAALAWAGPSVSFKLLILFLLLLYSNAAQVYPALEAFRPALAVALGAILMMILELAMARQAFRFAWPETYMLTAVVGICVVSSFSAFYARSAFDTTSDFIKVFLIFVLIENTVTSEDRVRKVMLTMVAGGLFPALGMIKNYMNGKLVEGSRAAWEGVFRNPNEAAYALVLLLPFAIVLMKDSGWVLRVALAATLAAFLLAIYLSFSRGGLVGLFAVLAMLGWKQKFIVRILMIAALCGALIVVGLFWARKDTFENVGEDTTFNQRIVTIKAGVRMFMDQPLFGVGPGCSLVAYPLYVSPEEHCGCEEMLVIHNAFIQVLSELGALGFIPWMVLLGFAIFHARRLQQKGTLRTPAEGLELAMWGFMTCSLSGGFAYTWFPYLVIGLIVASKRISDAKGDAA
ncbi:MAG: O-antigen ligase family protein [Acidobacteria bacterium]|nr:O-antigen ligase family protein [Acidobacteriota bacterium]